MESDAQWFRQIIIRKSIQPLGRKYKLIKFNTKNRFQPYSLASFH